MQHPKAIGDRTTLAVMLGLQASGFHVLIPFGENTRYDLGVDDGDRILKVQCKTGRLREGAVIFSPCSNYAHHGSSESPRRDYAGQIDAFGVWCADTAGVYLVPIEDVAAKAEARLRV